MSAVLLKSSAVTLLGTENSRTAPSFPDVETDPSFGLTHETLVRHDGRRPQVAAVADRPRRRQGTGAIVTRVPHPHVIDVIDATWVGVPPQRLAPHVADPANWRRWWPELRLEVDELRGVKGVRWHVLGDARGRLAGSMEIYLQPVAVGSGAEAGTMAHFFLRLNPRRGTRLRRRPAARLVERHRRRAKQVMWELTDRCDPGRLARVRAPGGRR
jgi:hypothetical protein